MGNCTAWAGYTWGGYCAITCGRCPVTPVAPGAAPSITAAPVTTPAVTAAATPAATAGVTPAATPTSTLPTGLLNAGANGSRSPSPAVTPLHHRQPFTHHSCHRHSHPQPHSGHHQPKCYHCCGHPQPHKRHPFCTGWSQLASLISLWSPSCKSNPYCNSCGGPSTIYISRESKSHGCGITACQWAHSWHWLHRCGA